MPGSRRSRQQQTRIAFTPLASTSPAAKDYHQQIKDRAAAVRYEADSMSPTKKRRVQFSSPIRDSHVQTYLPTPSTPNVERAAQAKPSSQQQERKNKKTGRQQELDPSTFTSSPFAVSSPARNGNMGGLSSDESDVPVRSSKKRKRSANNNFMSSGSSRTSRSQQRLDIGVSAPLPASSPLQPSSDSDSDDDEGDMPTTAGTRRRGSQRQAYQPSRSPSIDPPSEDELEVIEVRSRKKQRVSEDDDDENNDDAGPITPKRRLLKRPKQITQQERSDLVEDLEFLDPESDIDTPRAPRDTQTVKKSARMSALEALKRKRAGMSDDVGPSSEAAMPDEFIGVPDDEYDSLDDEHSVAPTSSRIMFQEDEDDENFLDDQEDATIGIPENLPIEFSKYASMKPKELFRYAVEWMVQKKINPAFNFSDKLYDLTFKKLNDEVSGLVSSRFSSAAWTSDFTLSFRARPRIAVQETGVSMELNHCDACNRSNHPATYIIQFQGKPYHPETLDDVEGIDEDDTSDGDEDDEDDKAAYDAQGRALPPASKIYHVGRFCAGRVETGHRLAHWKLFLFEYVVRWIEEHGYSTPAQIVERDKWSTKKRRKFANKLADKMHEQGATKRLWHEFQEIVTNAREFRQDRY